MKWNYDSNDGRYYIEGARISYTNFTGAENDYNREGSKNFKLRIDEDLSAFIRTLTFMVLPRRRSRGSTMII